MKATSLNSTAIVACAGSTITFSAGFTVLPQSNQIIQIHSDCSSSTNNSAISPNTAASFSVSGLISTNGSGSSVSLYSTNGGGGTLTFTMNATNQPPCSGVTSASTNATYAFEAIITQTVATTPSNRGRNTIGVGEQVNLSLAPAPSGTITWSSSCGGSFNPTNGASTVFTAPATAANCTITAQYPAGSCTTNFSVLAPTTVVKATIASTVSMPIGSAGAGMRLYPVVVGPTNVCLSAVMMVEVGEDASSISGYFLSNPPPSHIGHGADEWFALDQNNYWPSRWDYAVLGSADVPPPWSPGGFIWVIPSKWTVPGSNITNAMTGWSQVFSIDSSGTATVQKFGHSVTRTTNDVSTTN